MVRSRVSIGLVLAVAMSCLMVWMASKVVPVGAANEIADAPAGTLERNITTLISDPDLLDGWNTLRGIQGSVTLWNGAQLTGEDLAQFLLDEQIPVVWGSDEICGGSSCSRQYCSLDGRCSYEDGHPGIDPIYINPGARNQTTGKATRLANELAHEIYHRMQPFGSVMVTQLEEYWAFYVGTAIAGDAWPVFEDTDPFDPQQLQRWFSNPGFQGYLRLAAYPEGVAHSAEIIAVQPDLAGNILVPASSE